MKRERGYICPKKHPHISVYHRGKTSLYLTIRLGYGTPFFPDFVVNIFGMNLQKFLFMPNQISPRRIRYN